MVKKKISKAEAKKDIDEFFENLKEKTPKEVKKIKRVAMSYNIKLGDKRKLFCKGCYNPFIESSIRIKNDIITITCEHCGRKNRWKID